MWVALPSWRSTRSTADMRAEGSSPMHAAAAVAPTACRRSTSGPRSGAVSQRAQAEGSGVAPSASPVRSSRLAGADSGQPEDDLCRCVGHPAVAVEVGVVRRDGGADRLEGFNRLALEHQHPLEG